MKTKQFFSLALACVCAVAVGCSKGPKKPADLPALNPTTVTVVYDDGTPVDGATVILLPADGTNPKWNLAGVTDAQGKLVLKTNGNWDGAPTGSYAATVSKIVTIESDEVNADGSREVISDTRYVDEKYNSIQTSGLTAEIKDGDNKIELKVGEKVETAVQTI